MFVFKFILCIILFLCVQSCDRHRVNMIMWINSNKTSMSLPIKDLSGVQPLMDLHGDKNKYNKLKDDSIVIDNKNYLKTLEKNDKLRLNILKSGEFTIQLVLDTKQINRESFCLFCILNDKKIKLTEKLKDCSNIDFGIMRFGPVLKIISRNSYSTNCHDSSDTYLWKREYDLEKYQIITYVNDEHSKKLYINGKLIQTIPVIKQNPKMDISNWNDKYKIYIGGEEHVHSEKFKIYDISVFSSALSLLNLNYIHRNPRNKKCFYKLHQKRSIRKWRSSSNKKILKKPSSNLNKWFENKSANMKHWIRQFQKPKIQKHIQFYGNNNQHPGHHCTKKIKCPDFGLAKNLTLFSKKGSFYRKGTSTVYGNIASKNGVSGSGTLNLIGGTSVFGGPTIYLIAQDIYEEYNRLRNLCCKNLPSNFHEQDIPPGIYCVGNSIIKGNITLDGQANCTHHSHHSQSNGQQHNSGSGGSAGHGSGYSMFDDESGSGSYGSGSGSCSKCDKYDCCEHGSGSGSGSSKCKKYCDYDKCCKKKPPHNANPCKSKGLWIFIIKGYGILKTGGHDVLLKNGAQPCNAIWLVPKDAIIGENSKWKGRIIAKDDIFFKNGAELEGTAWALGDKFKLKNNMINGLNCSTDCKNKTHDKPPPECNDVEDCKIPHHPCFDSDFCNNQTIDKNQTCCCPNLFAQDEIIVEESNCFCGLGLNNTNITDLNQNAQTNGTYFGSCACPGDHIKGDCAEKICLSKKPKSGICHCHTPPPSCIYDQCGVCNGDGTTCSSVCDDPACNRTTALACALQKVSCSVVPPDLIHHHHHHNKTKILNELLNAEYILSANVSFIEGISNTSVILKCHANASQSIIDLITNSWVEMIDPNNFNCTSNLTDDQTTLHFRVYTLIIKMKDLFECLTGLSSSIITIHSFNHHTNMLDGVMKIMSTSMFGNMTLYTYPCSFNIKTGVNDSCPEKNFNKISILVMNSVECLRMTSFKDGHFFVDGNLFLDFTTCFNVLYGVPTNLIDPEIIGSMGFPMTIIQLSDCDPVELINNGRCCQKWRLMTNGGEFLNNPKKYKAQQNIQFEVNGVKLTINIIVQIRLFSKGGLVNNNLKIIVPIKKKKRKFTHDIATRLYLDAELTNPTESCYFGVRCCMHIALFKRPFNKTTDECLNCDKKNKEKKHSFTKNSVQITPGSCVLASHGDILKIKKIILKVLKQNGINPYTFLDLTPGYVQLFESTIDYYEYGNGTRCLSEVVFSFVIRQFHLKGALKKPFFKIIYGYTDGDAPFIISNYKKHKNEKSLHNYIAKYNYNKRRRHRHHHHHHLRKLKMECCPRNVCGIFDSNSCSMRDNWEGFICVVFILFGIIVLLLYIVYRLCLKHNEPTYIPLNVEEQEDKINNNTIIVIDDDQNYA